MIFTSSSKLLIKMLNKRRPGVELQGTLLILPCILTPIRWFGDTVWLAPNLCTYTSKNNSARCGHSLCFWNWIFNLSRGKMPFFLSMKTGFEPIIGKIWTQKIISCLSYYVMLIGKKNNLLLMWNDNACLIVYFSKTFWNYSLGLGEGVWRICGFHVW